MRGLPSVDMMTESVEVQEMEKIGHKDTDYCYMVDMLKKKMPHKLIASESELSTMGGEYTRLRLLPGKDIIILVEDKNLIRIFPPKSARPQLISRLHSSGKKADTIIFNARRMYVWPKLRLDVQEHVESCSTCLLYSPSKLAEAKQGLSTKLSSLKPLDSISCDIGERRTKSGIKQRFLAIVDRFSGFVSCFVLKGTKTRQIIAALDSYCALYQPVGKRKWGHTYISLRVFP